MELGVFGVGLGFLFQTGHRLLNLVSGANQPGILLQSLGLASIPELFAGVAGAVDPRGADRDLGGQVLAHPVRFLVAGVDLRGLLEGSQSVLRLPERTERTAGALQGLEILRIDEQDSAAGCQRGVPVARGAGRGRERQAAGDVLRVFGQDSLQGPHLAFVVLGQAGDGCGELRADRGEEPTRRTGVVRLVLRELRLANPLPTIQVVRIQIQSLKVEFNRVVPVAPFRGVLGLFHQLLSMHEAYPWITS